MSLNDLPDLKIELKIKHRNDKIYDPVLNDLSCDICKLELSKLKQLPHGLSWCTYYLQILIKK